MRKLGTLCWCFAIFFLAAPSLHAQTSTASLKGTVRDQTGAVIPGVAIVLTNSETSAAWRVSTNEAGIYVFPAVVPGPYRLTAAAPGMQTYEVTLTLQVQQSAVVDPELRPGQTTTHIEVQDVTPVVTVDSPTLGQVLERQRIEQLPINGRSIASLLVTVPGMEGNRAFGLRDASQEFVLDGSPVSDRNAGGNIRRPPGLDTVQAFKVETNSSSASFTRPTSVIISTRTGTNQFHGAAFETHRNNAIGKARQRQDFYEKAPHLVRNEFGASAGGPVWLPHLYNGHDRSFWFFAYEGYRNVAPSTEGFRVPTAAMRQGDFRGLVDAQGRLSKIYDPWTTNPATWQRQQFAYGGQANVIDPARISPLAKYLYSITPLPTMSNVNPLVADNWYGLLPDTGRQWTVTSRIDHRFSDRDMMYARYTQGNYNNFQDFGSLPALNNVASTKQVKAPNKSLALSWMHTFTPSFFNQILASVSREQWWTGTGEAGVKYADQLGLPNPFDAAGWPGIYDTGFSNLIYETENTQHTPFMYLILDDNATKVRGKHEIQFGFHYRYDQLNAMPEQQQIQGNHNFSTRATALYDPASSRTNPNPVSNTGHDAANMFLGIANYSNNFVRNFFYVRGREYASYLQDNYKATSRLTLNLGVRYEYWPAFREKNHLLTTFDPAQHAIVLGTELETMYRLGSTLPSIVNRLQSLGAKFMTYKDAGLPATLVNTPPYDFGPRLGFAYRAGGRSRPWVVRGGYRVSYFPLPLRAWTQRMRANAPLTAKFRASLTDAALSPDGIRDYGYRSIPTMVAGVNSREAVTLGDASALARGGVTVSYWAKDQPDPRVQDWNLTLEKEVLPHTLARVAYVGNHGSHLEQFYRYNENPPDYVWYTTTGLKLPSGEYSSVARRPYDQQVYGTVEEYRKTGWSNYNGMQFQLQRRYHNGVGFQVFYVVGNALGAGGQGNSGTSVIPGLNQFLPGLVPEDVEERNRFLNYQRDTSIPKHRLRWNWIADLPFGQGKLLGRSVGRGWNRLIGGWQIAGMGQLRTNYFALPTDSFPNGNKIEIYGYKYPIQDCRSGACLPGYLWWNGYIRPQQVNSVDANGKPNGIMGVPKEYKPAGQPYILWPADPNDKDPLAAYYGTNTAWVTLKDGTSQRTTYNTGLPPWRQQYLPGVRQWSLDASLFKRVMLTEKFGLRFNADFFNVLNRPGNPNSIGSNGILTTTNSGQSAREIQLTLRLMW